MAKRASKPGELLLGVVVLLAVVGGGASSLCSSCCGGKKSPPSKPYESEWAKQQREQREQMDAESRERQRQEQEVVVHRREARETIRAGRLDELRAKPTAALIKEVGPLLAKGERGAFCATYPYRKVLEERGAEPAAKATVATLKKREEKEMAKDRDGVAEVYCLCADGSLDAPIKSGRGKGSCCRGVERGGRVGQALTPTDQADCRGYDDVKLP